MGFPSTRRFNGNSYIAHSYIAPTILILSSLFGYSALCWFARRGSAAADLMRLHGNDLEMPQSEFDKLFMEEYYNYFNTLKSKAAEGEPSQRIKFDIDEWKYSSDGGLMNSDRVLLGDIYHNASSVFEFGLGESTQIAAHVGVPRYSGIDSDVKWVAQTRDKINMAYFRFYFADIGQTREWGVPVDKNMAKIPLNYQLQALYTEAEAFDVYMVDGRYRVACVAASFLHALSRGAHMSTIRVLLHDADRDAYLPLLKIAEIVERSARLYVLQLRHNVTKHELAGLWRKYARVSER